MDIVSGEEGRVVRRSSFVVVVADPSHPLRTIMPHHGREKHKWMHTSRIYGSALQFLSQSRNTSQYPPHSTYTPYTHTCIIHYPSPQQKKTKNKNPQKFKNRTKNKPLRLCPLAPPTATRSLVSEMLYMYLSFMYI